MARLDPEAATLIESEVKRQVWKLLIRAIAAIGLGTAASLVFWVPNQAAKIAINDPALKTVRDQILRDSGALEADTKRLRTQVDAASKELADLSGKLTELQKADAVAIAARVAALNQLGDDATKILGAIERVKAEVLAEVPKNVRVVAYGPKEHMGWGNKNTHQHFCPDRAPNQVMVGGAVGVGNGDFSVACGTIELVK